MSLRTVRVLGFILCFIGTPGCKSASKSAIEHAVKAALETKTGSKVEKLTLVQRAEEGGRHIGLAEIQVGEQGRSIHRSILFEALISGEHVSLVDTENQEAPQFDKPAGPDAHRAIQAKFQEERKRIAETLTRTWYSLFAAPILGLFAAASVGAAVWWISRIKKRRRRYFITKVLTWIYPAAMLVILGLGIALIQPPREMSLNRVACVMTGVELLGIGCLVFWTSAWMDNEASDLEIGQDNATQFKDSYAAGFFGFITVLSGIGVFFQVFSSRTFPPW